MVFRYREHSAKRLNKRASEAGGLGISMFKEAQKTYKPHDGSNKIRVLPPTWDDADHWGLDVWVHYGIGPDNSTIICPKQMEGEPCPICEERARAEKDGDEDYASELKPSKRVLIYLIDKKNPGEGLQVWASPQTLDQEFCTLAVDEESKEVLPVDDPKEGYNISFKREGTGKATRYKGVRFDQRPSSLGKRSFLEDAIDNPLPDLLNALDYEQIQEVFFGGASRDKEEEEEEEEERPSRRTSSRGKSGRASSRKGRRRSNRDEEEEEELDEEEEEFDEDDYENEEEEEEEEEERPRRGRGRSSAGSRGKSRRTSSSRRRR